LKLGARGDRLAMAMFGVMILTVRAARTAGFGTRAKRFGHDLPDGASTATALGTAAKAAIDLPGRARQITGVSHSVADVVVGKDVAGTDDHGLRSAGPVRTFTID
jgi:hypothetical protein